MSKIIDNYIKQLEANRASKNTIRNYGDVLNRLNNFKPINTVTKKDRSSKANRCYISY